MTSPFSSVQWQSCLADVPLIALPAMRCLLCGYSCEHECARASVQFCAWCRDDASTMHAEEMEALHRLANISPAFSVWSAGRRQDVPVSQPAKIFPGLPLYVGDMDDAANIPHLLTLGIGCVVNLCAGELTRAEYANLPAELATAGIHQQILVADDARGFDIISVARLAVGCINEIVNAVDETGVLLHCWGGVNRSAAVAAFYLVTECGMPLMQAVEHLMQRRGTVLTNYSFRTQLVQHCFRHGLSLDNGEMPPVLLEKAWSAQDGCMGCTRHLMEKDGLYPCTISRHAGETPAKKTRRGYRNKQLSSLKEKAR